TVSPTLASLSVLIFKPPYHNSVCQTPVQGDTAVLDLKYQVAAKRVHHGDLLAYHKSQLGKMPPYLVPSGYLEYCLCLARRGHRKRKHAPITPRQLFLTNYSATKKLDVSNCLAV